MFNTMDSPIEGPGNDVLLDCEPLPYMFVLKAKQLPYTALESTSKELLKISNYELDYQLKICLLE